MTNEILYMNGNLCSVVIFALIVRWSISLHSYSGENSPPMFGDYEAQRHWMEIAINLPVREWYFNTSNNDLLYWGLDYPPLTAYHSYVNGKIAQYINPDFVSLFKSRGFESYDHKFFMRTTVILTDFIVYFTSVILFFGTLYKNNTEWTNASRGEVPDRNCIKSEGFHLRISYLVQVAISLLYPGLILVDHGHFQYNSISLGLTVAAVWALLEDRFFASSLLFCLAVNYKQMSLYHSLPFFVYILSRCCPNKSQAFSVGCKRLCIVSLTVILTFSLIWFPFLKDKDLLMQVLRRLFPIGRGIFEDKVSNFWCTVNVFYKLNKAFTQSEMTKMCVFCVFATSSISLVNLFRDATIKKFILSLVNVSLSFFLFSYQVHEKSILLVSVPVLLYCPMDPFPCFWFLFISTFSMLPLFVKDNLVLPSFALTALFTLFIFANVSFPLLQGERDKVAKHKKNFGQTQTVAIVVKYAFTLSLLGCAILTFCALLVSPPARYPDLWPLLISMYSFLHFSQFLLYFNYVQVFKGKASS